MILRMSQQEMAVPRGDGAKIKTFSSLFTLHPEGGSNMFLRHVKFIPDFSAVYPRRHCSSYMLQ